MLDHEVGRQLGSAVHGGGLATTRMFAHFNADAVLIARSIVVGMIPLLAGGQVLHCLTIIGRVVPGNAPKFAISQGEGMAIGISPRRPVLGAVDGDVARGHVATSPPTRAARNNVAFEANLGKQRAGATRTRRTGATIRNIGRVAIDRAVAAGAPIKGVGTLILNGYHLGVLATTTREGETQEGSGQEEKKSIHHE